jgi:glycosyltransferase involved in cell wall biosynthesis
MRIAFVTPEFVTEEYFSGGLANYVYRVSKALVSLGHQIHVITYSTIDDTEFSHEGILVHRLTRTQLSKWLKRLTLFLLSSTPNWIDFSFQAYRKLRLLHKHSPIDIVQVPNYLACGLFTHFFFAVPQVLRISSYAPVWDEFSGINHDSDAVAMQWLERLQVRLTRYIYSPSHRLKRMLAEKLGRDDVPVIRTPFYVESCDWDTHLFQEHLKDKDYLLFFGRFELRKGVHILAQSLPQVFSQYPEMHAVFVGMGKSSGLAPIMKKYVLSLCPQYSERLLFLGQLPHAELYPIIAGARIVVLPSLIDNLPNTCLEAMALGKPVIGTQEASFEELITDGENGFLVPIANPKALAEKIIYVWSHPNLEEIGLAAKHRIKRFSPQFTVRHLLHFFETVTDRYFQKSPITTRG